MSVLCGLGFHAWDFCGCKRCARTRDRNHNWQGCKCSACRKTRDQDHNWQGCRCSACGKTRDQDHDWQGCKCSACDKRRDQGHDWKGRWCQICGKEDPLRQLLAICASDADWPEVCKGLYGTPEDPNWLYNTKQVGAYACRSGMMPAVVEALYPLLQSRNDDLKLSAIAVLLHFEKNIPPNPDLVDLLISVLSSKKSRVRYNSAKVLGNMNDARAVQPLATLMRKDSDQSVRERALWSIKELGAEGQVLAPDAPAIALSDIQKMTDAQRLNLLREVAKAAIDSVNAPGHLNTYDKRRATARHIGELLNASGGFALMRKTLEVDLAWMPGCRTIEGFWGGIGEWLG